MDWSSKKIIQTARELRCDYRFKTSDQIMETYGEFRDTFPKLFYTCLEPNFEIEELEKLLRLRQQAIEENTPDIIRDTTVGEIYAKKYVYPLTGTPTLDQKISAGKKVAQKYVELEKQTQNSDQSS